MTDFLQALERIRRRSARAWSPPPKLSLSEWADEHFWLNDPRRRWTTLPFQRGIMDALSDPAVETVTVEKSTRVGYTKILCAYIAYRIHLDPCGILVVQPTKEDAEGFSKDEIAPMIRDVPVLRGLVSEPRSRDSDNTLRKKAFPGGALHIIGAHSGLGFRRITVDVVGFDECDGYPPSAGSEGDQIELGLKRAHTALFPKFILGSSPKLKGTSRIERSWSESYQHDYLVPCPHCDHGQRLKWGGRDVDHGIKWPDGSPQEAYYLCEHCHCEIEHRLKNEIVARGDWVAPVEKKIDGADLPNTASDHWGFRIWAAYSPFPKAAWGVLAAEFLRVKDAPSRLQVFVNTVLGQVWEEQYEGVNADLIKRRDRYALRPGASADDDEPDYLVPKGVVMMTAGVDVHPDRLEMQVDGWGLGEECWKLEYNVLEGDATGDDVWEVLCEQLSRPRLMERGGEDYIRATCVDAGFLTLRVGDFCRPRWVSRTPDGRMAYVFAVIGRAGPGTLWPREPNRKNKARVKLYTLKVDAAKEQLYGRTQRIVEPGPGFIHWPVSAQFGQRYWDQFTAEKVRLTKDARGFPVRVWEKKGEGRRNEAFDTAVYSIAALEGLKAMGLDLEREAQRIATEPPAPIPQAAKPEGASAAPAKKQRSRRKWTPANL